MWLKYGVNEDNALVTIEDVPSGKTCLTCLYCGGGLIAKKGKIKEHHFAHMGETCRPVANRITHQDFPNLPLYDNFNIELSGKELEELKVFWNNYGVSNDEICIKPSLLKCILECTLYFLEIKARRKILHKIGVTKRPIEERISEIHRDLATHYKQVDIKVIDTWNHRGNVELYFKHRYKDSNYRIGKLTEYFKFDSVELVLQDLRQMKPKVLEPVELDILEGNVGTALPVTI